MPGIGDGESDVEELDVAAIMRKQREQAASLHQQAAQLRASAGECAPPTPRWLRCRAGSEVLACEAAWRSVRRSGAFSTAQTRLR